MHVAGAPRRFLVEPRFHIEEVEKECWSERTFLQIDEGSRRTSKRICEVTTDSAFVSALSCDFLTVCRSRLKSAAGVTCVTGRSIGRRLF